MISLLTMHSIRDGDQFKGLKHSPSRISCNSKEVYAIICVILLTVAWHFSSKELYEVA